MVAMSCGTTCRRRRDACASGPHHVSRPARRCPRRHGGDPSEPVVVGRYYDPATGQFLSVDPAIRTTSQAHIYADDNPITQVDPMGTVTSWKNAGPNPPSCSGAYTAVYNDFSWKWVIGGHGKATLYCGTSFFGLTHILAHYEQFISGKLSVYQPNWQQFVLFMASTLADWDVYQRTPEVNTTTYVILKSSDKIGFEPEGTSLKRPIAFSVVVAGGANEGSIITA